METLELLEVFGVTHFYDVASPEQIAELEDMIFESQAAYEKRAAREEIETCEDNDFGV